LVKRIFLIIAIGLIIAIIVASSYFLLTPKFLREEHLGGKYDAKLIITGNDTRGFEFGDITYTKDGVEHTGYYNSFLKNALDWIKNHTSENAVFLNSWGYGHVIVGYAERESVIKNPSKEALVSVAEPYRSEIKEFDPHKMIVDVAEALTSTNESLANAVMSKYDANYLLITSVDGSDGGYWMFYFAGLDSTQYFSFSPSPSTSAGERMLTFKDYNYTELGKQTMIYRLLSNSDLQVFTQVYSDENVKIFKTSM